MELPVTQFYDKFVNKLNREFTIDFETTNKYVDAICDFNLKPWDNIKLGDNIPQEHDQASVMRGGGIVSSVSPALLLESESEWLSSGCHDVMMLRRVASPWWRDVALTSEWRPLPPPARIRSDICPLLLWLRQQLGSLTMTVICSLYKVRWPINLDHFLQQIKLQILKIMTNYAFLLLSSILNST